MSETKAAAEAIPPSGQGILDLYKHQYDLAEKSLGIEREIVVKNFAALGAIVLAQGGFLISSLKPYVSLLGCGVVIILISIAARAMSILYGKYTSRLFRIAGIYRSAYLKGRDGLSIRKKKDSEEENNRLPDAERLYFSEFFSYRGTLAAINLIPAFVGVAMILAALGIVLSEPSPSSQSTSPSSAKTAVTSP